MIRIITKTIDDNDSYAIPIPAVREALDTMTYASVERVMFEMLFYTGCRTSELDHMTPELLHEHTIYWYPGKSQTGWRKEVLPAHYIKELQEYRRTHRVSTSQLFGISHGTFRRYFNVHIRPLLGPAWHQKRLRPRSRALEPEYILQLKGLRKTFQTMLFAKEWQRWGASEVALEFTSKRMKHSTTHMTAYHYLQHFDSLQIRGMTVLNPGDVIKPCAQLRMNDYT